MKRVYLLFALVFLMLSSISIINAQPKETYTGTVLSFGSGRDTRTRTNLFTLQINGQTSNQQVAGYLDILQSSGQDNLLNAIDNENLGRFSVGANVGVPVNVVRESVVDGKRRIFIVFKRWTYFAELRGGYRSIDYPFGVIEMSIDENTGKGEGTYIAAAQIRWKQDKKSGEYQVEIENFATFPARLMGVTKRN